MSIRLPECHSVSSSCELKTSAIAEYVASVTLESGLMPTDPGEAAQVRMWLHICEAEIMAPLSVVNKGLIHLIPYDDEMSDGILQTVHRRLTNINNWVSDREYLVGGRFTLADLTLASVLGHGYAKFFDKAWQGAYPYALEYHKRILADPKLNGALGEPVLVGKAAVWKPKEA
ncbi:glutathione S-transferase [Naematelia encephala]|uniref:Glutathione S-transferase n=1 Tax=Naematelia encephala TaxID=71784 RepID=A0A1Y2BCL7_9TREE|nr:glutathione S-transferase [Naematelia encephala]